MKHIVTVIIVLLSHSCVYAGNVNDILNHTRSQSEKVIKDIAQTHNDFKQYRLISNLNLENHLNTIETIKTQHVNITPALIKSAPEAVAFISFSMPDSSLKQIINDAAKYNIQVVLRGLYENSFHKTVEKIFSLVKEDNKGGVLINPNWFKQYDIKVVPALVVSNGKDFDVVYGNVLLKRMLNIVTAQGVNASIAKNILAGAKG